MGNFIQTVDTLVVYHLSSRIVCKTEAYEELTEYCWCGHCQVVKSIVLVAMFEECDKIAMTVVLASACDPIHIMDHRYSV